MSAFTTRDIIVFTNTLDKFMDYLDNNFVEIKVDIRKINDLLGLLRMSNPQMMMEQFNECLLPYNTYIDECNDDFFLNLSQELFNDSMILDLFHKIRKIWTNPTTSDVQKATIWFYIKTLLKITKKTRSL